MIFFPILIIKPKVFFISACRGRDISSTIKDDNVNPDDDNWVIWSDFFVCYSTLPGKNILFKFSCFIKIILKSNILGYQSFRNIDEGSWFGCDLVDTIKECANNTDLDNIVKLV